MKLCQTFPSFAYNNNTSIVLNCLEQTECTLTRGSASFPLDESNEGVVQNTEGGFLSQLFLFFFDTGSER